MRRHGRAGGRVAIQVDVGPAQGPGLLGADPAQQAQHDVGVHQLGGSADVLQAGPQFNHRESPGRGRERCGLVQGQGLGWSAFLALGGIGQDGDVAADQVVGFGVPDGALERKVPMLTAAVEYPAAMAASACRTSAAVRSRSFRAPMTARMGSRTFWFLVTVLGSGRPARWRASPGRVA